MNDPGKGRKALISGTRKKTNRGSSGELDPLFVLFVKDLPPWGAFLFAGGDQYRQTSKPSISASAHSVSA